MSGISVAFELKQRAADLDVTIFESSDRIGGKLKTTSIAGTQIECGADSFIVRDPKFIDALHRAGVSSALIEPQIFGGLVALDDRLAPLPTGTLLGVPASMRSVFASPLTIKGKARAMGGLIRPNALSGPDVAVGPWVAEQLGEEVLQRLVDPILAGTRAGDVNEMSLAAAMPAVDAGARKRGSLMRTLTAPRSRPRFLTHRDGMSALAQAMAKASGATTRTSCPVTSIERTSSGYLVVAGSDSYPVDAVAICVEGSRGGALIEALAPESARLIGSMPSASVASIALAWSKEFPLPPDSSGVLIPSSQGTTLSAATWWSLKWPHTGDSFVIRAFVGRSGHHDALDLTDETLAGKALQDLRRFLGHVPDPGSVVVSRWPGGMPVYPVGHLERVEAIDRDLAALPGLVITSAAFRGSGIPDIHAQASTAATRLLGGMKAARR
jgi:oxygen-dependent protoporphyrinogen oxidase